MSYDKKPSTWLGAGYAADAGAHTIGMNTNGAATNKTLPRLEDAEADPTTGDIVQLLDALLEALYQKYNGLAQADKPAHFSIYRQSAVNDADGTTQRTYSVQLDGAGDFTPATG